MTCPASVSHWFGRPCLRIGAARVTLTAGSARVTLAGARGICSCRHLSGAYSPPVPTRRAETSGGGAPCVPRERRVRPCISLAPCLCRPSVGDVGIVHVGAGPVALPELLARRPAASILRAPSRPDGSQCATGSGVRGSGGARPCRDIVRHPGGEIKTACAPPSAADGLDLSALLPFAADKGARAVKFSARGSRLALSDARPLIRHTRGRRRGVKATAADRRGEAAFTPRCCPAYPAAQGGEPRASVTRAIPAHGCARVCDDVDRRAKRSGADLSTKGTDTRNSARRTRRQSDAIRAHEAQREGSYRGGNSERTRARRGMRLNAEPSSTERGSLSPPGTAAPYRVPCDVDGLPSTKAGRRGLTTNEADRHFLP